MVDIKVGATYSTSNSMFPKVRVISELSRNQDPVTGKVYGPLRGYWVQVCDGKYHAPMTIDPIGFFNDYDGCLVKQIGPVLGKYKTTNFNFSEEYEED